MSVMQLNGCVHVHFPALWLNFLFEVPCVLSISIRACAVRVPFEFTFW